MNESKWTELLEKAVNEPGTLSAAYEMFHGYSIGNQFAAMWECKARGIEPGPIGTYKAWQTMKRQVRRGEKAITLCMPITSKATRKSTTTNEDESYTFTRFIWRNNWFVMSQTDGEAVVFPEIPGWDRTAALVGLEITEKAFDLMNGNTQGYCEDRTIAINPVAALPMKTTLHEMGHIMLGHTAEGRLNDSEMTPRNIREVEAECVALIVSDALGLDGAAESRGYIQNWNGHEPVSERSAQRIFSAADKILKAGRGETLKH